MRPRPWCLGFAAVGIWQLVVGPGGGRLADFEAGLTIVIVVVAILKILGAVVVLRAALSSGRPSPRAQWLLGVTLWGAFGLLAVYSAGNIFITLTTVTGLRAPSAAWTAAGGVTFKAVAYLLFFLVGSVLFGVVAVWFHRAEQLRWTYAAVGLVGAPLLLALLLG